LAADFVLAVLLEGVRIISCPYSKLWIPEKFQDFFGFPSFA